MPQFLADAIAEGFGGDRSAFNENYDPAAQSVIRDQFIRGSTESGEVGDCGWSFSNGSFSNVAAETDRIGIARRTSGTTANQVASMYQSTAGTTSRFLFGAVDEWTWIFRPVTADADFAFRIGLSSGPTTNPFPAGVYLERLSTDTSYFGVARSSSVETRTAALKSFVANEWTKCRFRRISATLVGFSIDGGAETEVSSNVPGAGGGMEPFCQIIPTTTTARSVDLDDFALRFNAVAR